MADIKFVGVLRGEEGERVIVELADSAEVVIIQDGPGVRECFAFTIGDARLLANSLLESVGVARAMSRTEPVPVVGRPGIEL